jgi:muramoyltetrapeptide carboxypeptidase
LNRRNFISLTASGLIFSKLYAKNIDLQDSIFSRQNIKPIDIKNPQMEENILPMALKKGSKIAITAPASPVSLYEIRNCMKILKNLGYSVEVGKTITSHEWKNRYLSAPDEERASEFMEYINRKDINCILCGRGGYGVMRILPMLDFDAIRRNPKIIIGFSDITALINAIYQKNKIVTFHGPVAVSTFGQFTTDYFIKVLAPTKQFKPIVINYPSIQTISNGVAEGKIIGGNLSMLAGTLGSEYEIDTNDSILLIEEISEHPYKIDRMLAQLSLAGKLQQAKGIIMGFFENLNSKRPYYPGGSFTIKEVIDQHIKPLEIPAILGMPIGHNKNNVTMPIGIRAKLDATKKTFTILEPSVRI